MRVVNTMVDIPIVIKHSGKEQVRVIVREDFQVTVIISEMVRAFTIEVEHENK